jgi:hypothetical protein
MHAANRSNFIGQNPLGVGIIEFIVYPSMNHGSQNESIGPNFLD